jgi:hypothetical protein
MKLYSGNKSDDITDDNSYGTDDIRIRNRLHKHTDTERMAYGYGTDDIRIRNGFHSTDTDTEQIT